MNKLNKGKAIGIVSLSLAAVSLAGVGFSAWVFSGTTTKDTGVISVTTAEVYDKRMEITAASVDNSDNSIKFDAVSGGNLITASSDAAEDLTFKINYTVKVGADLSNFGGVKGYVQNSGCDMLKAVNLNYVTLPAGVYVSEAEMEKGNVYITTSSEMENPTVDTSENKIYTVTGEKLTMDWGSAFNKNNPSKLTDASKVNDYITYLKELKGYNLSFTIVLCPCVQATQA